jgi:hypothetical protein
MLLHCCVKAILPPIRRQLCSAGHDKVIPAAAAAARHLSRRPQHHSYRAYIVFLWLPAADLPVDLSEHHVQSADHCHHVSKHEALAHEVGGLQVRKAGGADLAPAQSNTAATSAAM